MIHIKQLHKHFGKQHVLCGIDLHIAVGEKVVIVGPSGSGKSTLIRCINQLEKPTSGSVVVDGIDVTSPHAPIRQLRQSVAMVFQSFNLYPHKSVLENVTIAPIKVQKVAPKQAAESGMRYLERVGLTEKAGAYPAELSGGQQQRVAIARALNMHPKVVLFDEPTSALDPEMIQEVLDVIIGLSKENITMVVVTHEMGFARQASDRIIFMDEGEIVEQNEPEYFFSGAKNERTKLFLSKILRN